MPCAANLLINEFLPDPVGADDGREYVELLNTGPDEVDLAGVTLEFANGSVGAAWEVRWTGLAGEVLEPDGRYLLADRNWQGSAVPAAEVDLGLQNGPDALRLAQGGVVLDLVGYGPLTDPELFRGSAVPTAPGRALARRPDGRDTGDNAADFVQADPTPGAANFLPFALDLTTRSIEPPLAARPGDALQVGLVVRNTGTETLSAGSCRLRWPGGGGTAWWEATVPDAERQLVFVARPNVRGRVPLVLELVVAAAGTLRVEVGTVQVGAASLQLSEVQPAPGAGEGEWAELTWAGPGPLDLGGYGLRDADGGQCVLGSTLLSAGQRVVVAADGDGLAAWWAANAAAGTPGCRPDPAATVVLTPGAWPSLNNSAPGDRGFADRLHLVGNDGVVLDAVAWGGALGVPLPAGRSLERVRAEPLGGAVAWAPSTDPAGATPGCANSVADVGAEASAALTVAPRILAPGQGVSTVHLGFVLGPREAAWRAGVHDLWGAPVRDFGGGRGSGGPHSLAWDGRDGHGGRVPSGAYVAWVVTADGGGHTVRRLRALVVVR